MSEDTHGPSWDAQQVARLELEDQAMKELLDIKELLNRSIHQMRLIEAQRPPFIPDLIVARREAQVTLYWLEQCIKGSALG
jgi:hypothetical protein